MAGRERSWESAHGCGAAEVSCLPGGRIIAPRRRVGRPTQCARGPIRR